MSSFFIVFLFACLAKAFAFAARSSAYSSRTSLSFTFASSEILAAPAFFAMRSIGAIGISVNLVSPPKVRIGYLVGGWCINNFLQKNLKT